MNRKKVVRQKYSFMIKPFTFTTLATKDFAPEIQGKMFSGELYYVFGCLSYITVTLHLKILSEFTTFVTIKRKLIDTGIAF